MVTHAAVVPAKGTASLEIIDATEGVATAKAEALEPRARARLGVARHGATKKRDEVQARTER